METPITWLTAPQPASLPGKCVDIWRAPLADEALAARLATSLSPEECSRAARFSQERDRRRFVIARGILRSLLSRYLQRSPDAFPIASTALGKPVLAAGFASNSIRFNVSHSADLALFAFAENREIGIDLEHLRPGIDALQLGQRFFSESEAAQLAALPSNLQAEAFLRCWTRKEAYMKAHGKGLQMPLSSFSVSLLPGEPPRLLSFDSERWSIHSFLPAPEFVAALVVEGPPEALRFFEVPSFE